MRFEKRKKKAGETFLEVKKKKKPMSPGGLFQAPTQKGAVFTNPEVGGGAWLQTTKSEIGTILPKNSPASLPPPQSPKDQLCHSN